MNILKKLTQRYLKLNRKRTIVTIIGIILSGAMISAVTTLGVSFQNFLINNEKEEGAWEVIYKDISKDDLKYIENNINTKEYMLTSDLYMAENDYSNEEYIKIYGYDDKALEDMGVKLVKGKLPTNSDEIVLSRTFFDGKDNEPKIGDSINFDYGNFDENSNFIKEGSKTYKITGIIERPNFEGSGDYFTSGITKLEDSNSVSTYDVAVITKNPKNIFEESQELAQNLDSYKEKNLEEKIQYNNTLLSYMGISQDDGLIAFLYSICAILLIVISVGAILVIYNAFAISVSERKKQFGMLSSVGATKKQIRKSVLYEGFIIGVIGIPIGIVCGILGIWVVLSIVNNLIKPLFTTMSTNLDLVVSVPAIIIAIIAMALTIYVSVIIPAVKASRITPIEAIRQSGDIKVKSRKLRTPKFIRKIFGVEGDIALKNLKRSKGKYRTTVISLTISIILFITVSDFVNGMSKEFNGVYYDKNYDFSLNIYSGSQDNESVAEEKENIINKIKTQEGITQLITVNQFNSTIKLSDDKVNKELRKLIEENEYMKYIFDLDDMEINIKYITYDNDTLQEYMKKVGINQLNNNEAILVNYANQIGTEVNAEYHMSNYKENDLITIQKDYTNTENDENIKICKVTDEIPDNINKYYTGMILVVNNDTFNNIIKNDYITTNILINVKKDKQDSMRILLKEILNENTQLSITLSDIVNETTQSKNMMLIIQIFLYGFIVLISAVGISNVFNTISTNIALRKREFANLKSVGMTEKGFKKMLNLECIFYGTKSLLYGIPISIFICYLINKSFNYQSYMLFNIPWLSIIISVVAVFLVVYITMIYSRNQIKKENIVDVLRNDNI